MAQDDSRPAPHIALVSGGLPLGGSTTFLLNLAGELVRRSVPVEILNLQHENPLAEAFQEQHIPVLCPNRRWKIFEDRLTGALRELAHFKPTVVVATLDATSFEVLRYLPEGVFRVGVGQSDDGIVYGMMRHYAPWMDLAAMVSQAMKQKAEAMPEFAATPVAYLRHGVPMCGEEEVSQRNFTAPLRIIYLGRLDREQKRVHLFPKIFRGLCESGIPFHWTIVGQGGERALLEANMKTVSPEQSVSLTAAVAPACVPELLRAHDIYLLVSDFEGLPLSLLEAMGHGLVPVVSGLSSGIPEVVGKTTGILVPVNDPAGYARAIIHLHEHRGELAAKSAAARARVKKDFSVEAMTDRWLAVFPKTFPPIQWPSRWDILAPLPARRPVYFSPPMRMLRRLAAKFR